MKKQIIIIGIFAMLLVVGLSGCINDSNINGETNGEPNGETNGEPNVESNTSDEKRIVGVWEREDGRVFNYENDGSLHIVLAADNYTYWFENGYLYDSAENTTIQYKYSVNFTSNDVMIITYFGYYDDNEWHEESPPRIYHFQRKV